MAVTIGKVETFPDAKADKAQVMKVSEETLEVFSAWEMYRYGITAVDKQKGGPAEELTSMLAYYSRGDLINECADLIQAVSNLLAGLGVDDMTDAMERCRERNVERGRM